ncbi:hypothetical protein GGR00_003565 [Aminobacter aganoensis]|uniref:Uncharacterized protein n=1 Tax=Aminobacter aganoensis TaxID=83264 RepID=A0A7X0F9W0_9HYPH|nr:hypothetical protein [Aminobacter aganoensis]
MFRACGCQLTFWRPAIPARSSVRPHSEDTGKRHCQAVEVCNPKCRTRALPLPDYEGAHVTSLIGAPLAADPGDGGQLVASYTLR